jgi:hypothetical protein
MSHGINATRELKHALIPTQNIQAAVLKHKEACILENSGL